MLDNIESLDEFYRLEALKIQIADLEAEIKELKSIDEKPFNPLELSFEQFTTNTYKKILGPIDFTLTMIEPNIWSLVELHLINPPRVIARFTALKIKSHRFGKEILENLDVIRIIGDLIV